MKRFLQSIGIVTLSFLLTASVVHATTVAFPIVGGMGWGAPGGIKQGSILFGRDLSQLGTSSALYWDSTNNYLGIGIDLSSGLDAVSYPLDVRGTIEVQGVPLSGNSAKIIMNGSTASGYNQYYFESGGSGTSLGSSKWRLYDNGLGSVAILSARDTINDVDRIGIGTSTPTGVLSVDCVGLLPGFVVGSTTYRGAQPQPATELFRVGGTNCAPTVSIASTSPWAVLAVNPIAGAASNQFVVGSSSATNFIIDNSGNAGVGTTTPYSPFAVTGTSSASQFVSDGTATSTFNFNGLNLLKGCFAINGTCVSGAVSQVSNSDGTLTISPTTGAVVASLALAHAQTWTGLQTLNPSTAGVNAISATPATGASNSAAGGFSFTSAAGGGGSGAAGGTGSTLTVSAASGGAAPGAAFTGGQGSTIAMTLGNGGAGAAFAGANGGTGGAYTITAGQGGAGGTGSTASNGGNGSALTFAGAKGGTGGGASGGNGTSGVGSTISMTTGIGGTGGSNASANGGTGGNGGALSLTGAAGGAGGANGGSNTNGGSGGTGAGLTLTSGAGGNGANPAGAGTGGNGGNGGTISFQAGAGGTAGTLGTAGTRGFITFQTTAGLVGVGSSTPFAKLSVNAIAGDAAQFLVGSSTGTFFLIDNIGKIGIGTTSPWGMTSIQQFNSATTPVFEVATSSGTPVFDIFGDGHIKTTGPRPTVSSCGTSPTIYGNNVDFHLYAGTTLATSCTVTFAPPGYTIAPVCLVTQQTGTALAVVASSTPTTLVISGGTFTADRFAIHCEEPNEDH